MQYLLESPSGVLWDIYRDEDMYIVYSKKENDSWSATSPLDKYKVESFSATIDIDEKVHIVAYTTTGQLIYYQWDGSQWLYSILTTIRSRFHDVPFIKIISSKEQVNIFYHMENAISRSKDSIYHYHGDGFSWDGGKIHTVPSEENIIVNDVFWYDENNIYLYYSATEDSETSIYRLHFDKKDSLWSNPIPVLYIPLSLEDIQICLDSQKRKHLIGVEREGNIYTLYYIENSGRYTAIKSQPKRFVSPAIIASDRQIYISWNTDNKVFSSTLDKGGSKFSGPREVENDDISILNSIKVRNGGISESKRSWTSISPNADVDEIGLFYKPQSDEIELIQRDISLLKTQIANLETQFDDLYSLCHDLHEHVSQYQKSLYQIQLTVKKHANDIERLQDMPTRSQYQKSVDFSVESEDEPELEGEVVDLGDAKIIINNEEDESDES